MISYADYDESELEGFAPRVVHVDCDNRVIDEFEAVSLAADQNPSRFLA